jgi:dTMP kinase
MASSYIAFEGADFSGKSTQAARLAAHLDAVLTREPGGTTIGGLVRQILLDPAHDVMVDRAEALLYAADRAQHQHEVVRPALAAGRHVVSDRSAWASVVYQGMARGLGADDVRRVNDWAVEGHWPDLVVLLDVDTALAATRLTRDPDRLEQAGPGFQEKVREGYRALASSDPAGWVVVPADGTPDDVAAAVLAAVHERLGL